MTERVGIGYDVHRLEQGRGFVLGGAEIPFPKKLIGHSDADVLSHAIIDAVLGAAGLGDIGVHSPKNDALDLEKIKSVFLLSQAVADVKAHGFVISNVDATVIVEEPMIGGEYRDRMIRELAAAMGIEEELVNIKFTTNEGVGEIGRGEAIAAMAVARLEETRD